MDDQDHIPDDPVLMYLREVASCPPLTRDEEIFCSQTIHESTDHDEIEEAKRKLIEGHLLLALSITREYEGQGLSVLDLLQEANIGLMMAVEQFDHTVHGSFSIHAAPLIRQRIIAALTEQ